MVTFHVESVSFCLTRSPHRASIRSFPVVLNAVKRGGGRPQYVHFFLWTFHNDVNLNRMALWTPRKSLLVHTVRYSQQLKFKAKVQYLRQRAVLHLQRRAHACTWCRNTVVSLQLLHHKVEIYILIELWPTNVGPSIVDQTHFGTHFQITFLKIVFLNTLFKYGVLLQILNVRTKMGPVRYRKSILIT